MSDWPTQTATGALVAQAIFYGVLFVGILIIFVGLGTETGLAGIALGLILVAVLYPFVGLIFFQTLKELLRRRREKRRI